MENIMNSNLHSSNLGNLSKIRMELWEIVNRNFKSVDFFIQEFYKVFEGCSISYDMKNMQFTIIRQDNIVEPTLVINGKVLVCFNNAINELYKDQRISDYLYNECIKAPNLLFNVILNHNNAIVIKL